MTQTPHEQLDSAVEALFRLLIEAKKEKVPTSRVTENLARIMCDDYNVQTSYGWIERALKGGKTSMETSSWLRVHAFIDMMHEPRTTDRALVNLPFIYRTGDPLEPLRVRKP